MGSANSSPDLSALERLTGRMPIARDDSFWQTLLNSKVPLERGGSVADLEQTTQHFCAELLRNNRQSGNFQALMLCALDRLQQAQSSRATLAELEQCCGAIMLVRLFLRHMVETLEAEVRAAATRLLRTRAR